MLLRSNLPPSRGAFKQSSCRPKMRASRHVFRAPACGKIKRRVFELGSGIVTGRLPVRRRLQIYLPVFLAALMVQIFAPIGASWTAASSLSDPLAAFGGAAICHSGGSEADGQTDQPGQTDHHVHDVCALCCLAHAGNSTDAPKAAFTAPYRSSLRVVWYDAEQQLRNSRNSGHAQARAPPSDS